MMRELFLVYKKYKSLKTKMKTNTSHWRNGARPNRTV